MSTQNSEKESPELAAAKTLEGALNTFSFNYPEFLNHFGQMHHTLQQSFFRLMQKSILFMAEPGNVSIDPRNQRSFEMCQELREVIKKYHLPVR